MIDISPLLVALERHCSRMEEMGNDSFRVFHGRGKCFPELDWLNLDYHANLLVLTVFSTRAEEKELCIARLKTEIERFIVEHQDKISVDKFLIQRRDLDGAPFFSDGLAFQETNYAFRHGLKYGLSFAQQNAGFFLDIEPARQWLVSHCEGKRVLNLFAYTCAFSVVAMAAGAESVVNIDLSKRSLTRGKENHLGNGISIENVKFLGHDIFKSWGKLKKYGPYDIVICDPPSFQKGSFVATKDYPKLVRRVESLLAEQGVALFCLNAPEVSREAFRDQIENDAQELVFDSCLPINVDFPERDEGCGLKMLVFRRDG